MENQNPTTEGFEQAPSPEPTGTTSVPATTMIIGGREMQAYDFGNDAGAGMENLGIDEQLIPFITILQGLSPQVDRTKPEYIEGAAIGMLMNTATKTVYDVLDPNAGENKRGLPFIPVWREHQFTEWVPRNDTQFPDGKMVKGNSGGGGFRGIHDPNSPEVRAAIEHALQTGGRTALFRPLYFHNKETNEETVLIDQYNLGIIYGWPMLDEFFAKRAMVAFTSTKIGVYKAFITAADDIKYPNPRTGQMASPPMWAHRWRLGVVSQKNNKGEFFNYRTDLESRPSHTALVPMNSPLYIAGKEFYTQWREGKIRGDYTAAEQSAGQDSGAGAGRTIDPDSTHIPF